MEVMIAATRRRVTSRAQRSPIVTLSVPGLRPRPARRPMNPSRAGSKVSAISTATATVPAAASPITDRNGIWTTTRPTSAMITVSPAKTTALPAVAVGARDRLGRVQPVARAAGGGARR